MTSDSDTSISKSKVRKVIQMFSFLSPEKAARFSAKHPLYMLGIWVLIIAAAIMGAGMTRTETNASENPKLESERALRVIERESGVEPATENIIVISDKQTVDSPAYRAFVTQLTSEVRSLDGTVASVTNYYETGDSALVSPDKSKTIIAAVLTGDPKEADVTVLPLLDVVKTVNADAAFDVKTVGVGSLGHELSKVFEEDAARSEFVGLPAALVVLVIVFGAVVAASLPLILSVLAIIVAVGITGVLSRFVAMGDIVMNMIIMIGLAVGIDYALFIVERFREEQARGLNKIDAIAKAGSTASRAVLFSGITVIIALGGLLIVPSTTFHGLSLGAIAAVIGAVLAALTLLPAALSLLGNKVNALHLPGRGKVQTHDSDSGFWARATRVVMQHPLIAIVATVAILGAAAAPAVTMKVGSPSIGDMPQNLSSVQAFNILDNDFGAGRLDPVEIVIEGNANSASVNQAVDRLESIVSKDARFGEVSEVMTTANGRVSRVQVYVNGDSIGLDAQEAVRKLRGSYIPAAFNGVDAKVLVGGGTAANIDYIDSMKTYLPIVIGFVLTLSFVLLTLVFRSIVIPVKAIIMNLLSVGAAYGLIVAVFQHGIGADLLGFQRSDSVMAFLPVFLFAILFGLSMDYHVFLLSRIQERFLRTGDNRGSVAAGLQSTAHIISGAAVIMVVVFGAFALGQTIDMQQVGFGLAVAVFVDATLIRSILVPASMELLGNRNWYLPTWLEWLPQINVEGHTVAPRRHEAMPRRLELSPVPVRITD
ncbi:MAG TPA: MMPL family transporter [Dehalococcoidia bacterium]|nr:MMPL family transporter [Dehalococcoidia bacterium]